MNERIKALLLNARNMFVNGVTESDNKIYIHGSEENLEKFAELIIRECAFVAQNKDDTDINFRLARGLAAFKILQHFGVEE